MPRGLSLSISQSFRSSFFFVGFNSIDFGFRRLEFVCWELEMMRMVKVGFCGFSSLEIVTGLFTFIKLRQFSNDARWWDLG